MTDTISQEDLDQLKAAGVQVRHKGRTTPPLPQAAPSPPSAPPLPPSPDPSLELAINGVSRDVVEATMVMVQQGEAQGVRLNAIAEQMAAALKSQGPRQRVKSMQISNIKRDKGMEIKSLTITPVYEDLPG